MKVADLQRDEALRRREFPACARGAFLAHAGVSPLPRAAAEAMVAYIQRAATEDQEAAAPAGQLLRRCRHLAAKLLGCEDSAISLVGPTSLGLSLVAAGLPWQPGDNVVFYRGDYPANVAPWLALAERGVEPREIRVWRYGCVTLDDVARRVDDRTRLIAISSAHFLTGYTPDLEALAAFLRDRGVLLCVDGIQTLGAVRLPLQHVDFLAADAHKWLLGPCGAGIFYASARGRAQLRPVLSGAGNAHCPDYHIAGALRLKEGAGRYEPGTAFLAGLVGFAASLQLLLDADRDEIEATVQDHTRFLRDRLHTQGYELADPEGTRLSGITAFRRGDLDLTRLHGELKAAGFTLSLRRSPDGRSWLRAAPHFYNTRAELGELLKQLP